MLSVQGCPAQPGEATGAEQTQDLEPDAVGKGPGFTQLQQGPQSSGVSASSAIHWGWGWSHPELLRGLKPILQPTL